METLDEKVDRICDHLGVHLLDYQKTILKHYLENRSTANIMVHMPSGCYGKTLMECLRLLMSPDVKPFTIEEFDKMVVSQNDTDGLHGYIIMLDQRLRKAGIITNLRR